MTVNTGPAKTGPAGSLAMAMMVEPNLTCSLVSTLTVIQLSESQSTCNASKNSCATHGDLKSILIIVSIHNSGTFCTHAAVMVHPETTSSPEKQNRQSVKGSRKLEDYCLARMYVKHYQSTGRVEVTYICTHTNHLPGLEECKYLPLPQFVRKEIQEKFAQGVTLERIMDGV